MYLNYDTKLNKPQPQFNSELTKRYRSEAPKSIITAISGSARNYA